MRSLIALALIAVFLAIAAAVAIPNLLESRRAAREDAAVTALKAKLLPAEVQFQAAGYLDRDHDGIGEYASATGLGAGKTYLVLAGGTTTPAGLTLNLLAPEYRAATPLVEGYRFDDPVSKPGEQYLVWAAAAEPADADAGSRYFGITQSGNLVMCSVAEHPVCPDAVELLAPAPAPVHAVPGMGPRR